MKKLLLISAAALTLMTAPAHAQLIVFDPTNYAQNILTAAHTLETINNQVRQLQNEALNLTSLNFSSLAELRAALTSANQLIQQAQGLAYQVSTMQADFSRLYPQAYTSAISGSQMAHDARQRWDYSLKALGAAMRVQAQAVQNFASDENTLTDLVDRSQSAVGALQAAQATNQLLALQSRQAMQEQQLRITQDRAVGLELARVVAAQERAREVRRRFQGDGTRYTPQTVKFYSP
ncbi:P-type conjugative transfer protein TrbJ [Caenimonas soli]|uniref:P-type conjugative transfer protein TrbJ n=1 Tax=Caenimonas soli TaxID=2735555 RepID=UPI0015524DFC|nr:P-type conjugative transfer protein TrbJ [Caenimonas soli]NPC57783.1 P-type conjugative transfer protein TrbJ [Caenimonas soli]